jgi:hypothetical protein
VPADKIFRDLRRDLQQLQEALEALGTTIEEDRPARGDVVVASSLSDAVLAARGFLEEALTAADAACRAIAAPVCAEGVRQALSACQESFQRFATQFALELASFERIDDLRSVGRERGREWQGWATVVRQAVEQCRALVEEVRAALFRCWQELAERATATAVSIQNTTIGQIAVAEPARKRAGADSAAEVVRR